MYLQAAHLFECGTHYRNTYRNIACVYMLININMCGAVMNVCSSTWSLCVCFKLECYPVEKMSCCIINLKSSYLTHYWFQEWWSYWCIVCFRHKCYCCLCLLIWLHRKPGMEPEVNHVSPVNDSSKKRLIEDTEDWHPRTGTSQSRSFRILAQLTGTENGV